MQQTIIAPSKIGPYLFRGTVGEGAFSVVKLAFHEDLKTYFACKIVPRNKLQSQDMEERFEIETRINQQMHHPGIVQIVDLLKDDLNYYIFMEFCSNGELFKFIVERGKLPEPEAKILVHQVLLALKYVHFLGVAHRDLKPENLLIDYTGHIKISDFGLSHFVDANGLVETPCGSPCYASPECLSGRPYNGKKSDMWSLGVIVFAMVTGQLPWTKRNQNQLFNQIRKGDYKIPEFLSPTCRDLIARMLTVDCEQRINDDEALEHPWFEGAVDQTPPPTQVFALISLRKIDNFFDNTDFQSSSEVNKEEINALRISSSQVDLDYSKVVRKIIVKGFQPSKFTQPAFKPIRGSYDNTKNHNLPNKTIFNKTAPSIPGLLNTTKPKIIIPKSESRHNSMILNGVYV